jgi:hypothetical protein
MGIAHAQRYGMARWYRMRASDGMAVAERRGRAVSRSVGAWGPVSGPHVEES